MIFWVTNSTIIHGALVEFDIFLDSTYYWLMDLHELPFAKIIILHDNVAEVMIDDCVIMNEKMVDDYHDFLLSHLHSPFYLLINKINSYTYDFPSQMKIATLKEINAMAVVSYNRATTITTETLASYPRAEKWNLKVFSNRDEALVWLFSEQKKYDELKSSQVQ